MPKPKKFPNNIHFTPGAVLGPWLEQYRKMRGLEKPQDAIREIIRDRMLQEQEAKMNYHAQAVRA
jgi:hypothetical protein